MYWNIIDEKRYDLLKKITDTISIPHYYMIGGTALSIQMGLRLSYDFDFCVPDKFNNELLLQELKKIGTVEVKQNQKGTCDVVLNGVQISFFYYPNRVIKEYIKAVEMPKLKMASILDIAVMKVIAISGRGSKKDFFDLYNILTKEDITMDDLLEGIIKKYGKDINYMSIIMGLNYFEDAEQEILPETFVDYKWELIKKFFIDFQLEFEKRIENLDI